MKVDPLSSLGFIPMDGWAFRLFMAGAKDTEFRILGGRFVAKHYPVGRLVVISAGYGRGLRALARVRAFDALDSPPDLEQWARVYGTWKTWTGRKVAAIGLDVLAPVRVDPFRPGWFSFYGSEWVDFDGVLSIVQKIPPDVWSGPRVKPDRVHQSAILFHDLVDKTFRRAPLGGCSICDCTTLVADELPDSDEFRRAYRDAMLGGFVRVGPEVVTLEHDGLHRGQSFLQGLPGPPSRMEIAYLPAPEPLTLASLPATFEETAAQLGKASGFPPNPSPGSPQALPEK